MPVGRAKLVADDGADAGFDPTGAQRDQPEADHQARPGIVERERKMSAAVGDREQNDRAVLAEHRVRQLQSAFAAFGPVLR